MLLSAVPGGMGRRFPQCITRVFFYVATTKSCVCTKVLNLSQNLKKVQVTNLNPVPSDWKKIEYTKRYRFLKLPFPELLKRPFSRM